MKTVTAYCELCKKKFEHQSQLVVNQMMGYHKRVAHGIPGRTANLETKRLLSRESYWRKQGYSQEEIEHRRARYEAKHSQSPVPTAEEPVRKMKKATDAVPLALTECPLCKARFYYTAEQKGQ